jgi:hypothetical protein
MRLLHWDDKNPHSIPPNRPYTWGDKNLFFGPDGKGYAREPGDEFFIPYSPVTPPISEPEPKPNPRKPRQMKRQDFYPSRQADQAVWLENFRLKLALYAAALGLSPQRTSDCIADARWLVYLIVSWLESVRTHGKAATSALSQAQTGSGPLALPTFTPPTLPDGVEARPAGALDRIFDLIAEIKENGACTEPMCLDLGILGSVEPAPDMNKLVLG